MSNKDSIFTPQDSSPLPPKDAEVITTACDYCIVACGYKAYRWPVGKDGGPKAADNAFGLDFPTNLLQAWVAPTQHTVVTHEGKKYNLIVIPDKDAKVVNKSGDSSIRGGLLAQKLYNPDTPTADRLQKPLVRVNGELVPTSWEDALDIAAEVSKHVVKKHGANSFSAKQFSYQFVENTYALSKFFKRHINTAAFTFHDTPSDVTSTPGFRDAGYDNFGPAYKDWGSAETLLVCGTDPYETKTILFTQYIMPAIARGQKVIMLNPRETAGVAYVKKMGGLHLQIFPGTDTLVVGAITRAILENGWEDKEWVKKWVNNKWGSNSGFGQGTRNTPWQWRSTWGKFQTKGFEDYKKWLLSQDEYTAENAAKIAGIDAADILKAAEWMAKPKGGKHPKTSIGIEKGFYWSNNTGNTNAISSLATSVGAGGRPGRMVGRFGGHQRGGTSGGGYPRNKSPEKVPGRRKRALDTDRWLVSGNTRLAYVVGTTWIQSMTGTDGLHKAFHKLVTANPNQPKSKNKDDIIKTLKARADSGGMVVINHDIYLRDPIGAKFADVVFPAATWGEEDFIRANGERRLRLYQKLADAPGEAKPDWWIIAQVAKRMGFDGFDWKNSNEVAEESSRFSRGNRKAYHMIKVAAHLEGKTLHEKLREYGTEGIQGPTTYNYKTGKLYGCVRLHNTLLPQRIAEERGANQGANMANKKMTHFNSQTGKINIQKHPWGLYSDIWEFVAPKDDEELWHTNGRINEIWQTGFDDRARRKYIKQRWPYQFVEIHPADAKKRGIESGDKVLVYSDRVPVHKHTIHGVGGNDFQFSELKKNGHIDIQKGAFEAIALVSTVIKQGVLFSDALNTEQPSNSVQARVVDNISGNYNYKLGSAKIKKIGESEYKSEFTHMSFVPRNIVT